MRRRRLPRSAPPPPEDDRAVAQAVELERREFIHELCALCEDTEDRYADAAKNTENNEGAFARGRIIEAKSIRKAMGEVYATRLSVRAEARDEARAAHQATADKLAEVLENYWKLDNESRAEIERLRTRLEMSDAMVIQKSEQYIAERRAHGETVNLGHAREALASLSEASPSETWKPTHRHYKGGLYRVIARGRIEADLSPVVIYDNAAGETWVRPVDDFDQKDPFVRFAALSGANAVASATSASPSPIVVIGPDDPILADPEADARLREFMAADAEASLRDAALEDAAKIIDARIGQLEISRMSATYTEQDEALVRIRAVQANLANVGEHIRALKSQDVRCVLETTEAAEKRRDENSITWPSDGEKHQ